MAAAINEGSLIEGAILDYCYGATGTWVEALIDFEGPWPKMLESSEEESEDDESSSPTNELPFMVYYLDNWIPVLSSEVQPLSPLAKASLPARLSLPITYWPGPATPSLVIRVSFYKVDTSAAV